mmetsp:Transcript_37078/g.106801  ORF Transcript_37078/g.106801 Transcript_37078/m.106801 type:complete len:201 (+) Transcript_37078:483-1085(+)
MTNLPNSSRESASTRSKTSDTTALALARAQECCTRRRTVRHPNLSLAVRTALPMSSSAIKATCSDGRTSSACFTTWFACGWRMASSTWPRNCPSTAAVSSCTRQRRAGAASRSARPRIVRARCTARLEAPSRQAKAQTWAAGRRASAEVWASAMMCSGWTSENSGQRAVCLRVSCSSSSAARSYSTGQERSGMAARPPVP